MSITRSERTLSPPGSEVKARWHQHSDLQRRVRRRCKTLPKWQLLIGIPIKYGIVLPVRSCNENRRSLVLGDRFAEGFQLAQPRNNLVPTRNALGRQHSK